MSLLRSWYCLQVADKAEEKVVTRIYQSMPKYLDDYIIDSIEFKVPKDNDGNPLYPGYIFMYCELSFDIVETMKSVPYWIRFLDKVDYTRRKNSKGELGTAFPVVWNEESLSIKDKKSIALDDVPLNKAVIELNLIVETLYKIQSGPFAGFTCMFKKLQYNERKASVVIKLFERPTEVVIDVKDLREMEQF